MKVRVEGPLAFNSSKLVLEAAVAGCGLACLLEDRVKRHLKSGELIRVLADWCPPFAGYFLYYPSRRQPSPAFTLLAEALRHR
jgi:DNA-binding transcriptional LysR family regulator